ncbi:hypothetical protein HDU97_003169 [Phlyctochytrium planicorne]|nr:hypothetical protein HDU97_003169 [Phlyctochytrium planicorne]
MKSAAPGKPLSDSSPQKILADASHLREAASDPKSEPVAKEAKLRKTLTSNGNLKGRTMPSYVPPPPHPLPPSSSTALSSILPINPPPKAPTPANNTNPLPPSIPITPASNSFPSRSHFIPASSSNPYAPVLYYPPPSTAPHPTNGLISGYLGIGQHRQTYTQPRNTALSTGAMIPLPTPPLPFGMSGLPTAAPPSTNTTGSSVPSSSKIPFTASPLSTPSFNLSPSSPRSNISHGTAGRRVEFGSFGGDEKVIVEVHDLGKKAMVAGKDTAEATEALALCEELATESVKQKANAWPVVVGSLSNPKSFATSVGQRSSGNPVASPVASVVTAALAQRNRGDLTKASDSSISRSSNTANSKETTKPGLPASASAPASTSSSRSLLESSLNPRNTADVVVMKKVGELRGAWAAGAPKVSTPPAPPATAPPAGATTITAKGSDKNLQDKTMVSKGSSKPATMAWSAVVAKSTGSSGAKSISHGKASHGEHQRSKEIGEGKAGAMESDLDTGSQRGQPSTLPRPASCLEQARDKPLTGKDGGTNACRP